MLTPLIPSCTDAYLTRCLQSMNEHRKWSSSYTIVADSGLTPGVREAWAAAGTKFVNVPLPFIFARAINLAAKYAPPDNHLLVLNDDTEAVTLDWYDKLAFVINHHPRIGLLAAMIEGSVGNPEQQVDRVGANVLGREIVSAQHTLCFTAVVIRREVWDTVGPLDERFTGYGFDDDDYNRRVRDAGYETAVTGLVTFRHGVPGHALSSTYAEKFDHPTLTKMFHENAARYLEKWGSPPQ